VANFRPEANLVFGVGVGQGRVRWPGLLGQKVAQRSDLIGCGIPSQRLQVKALDALGGFDSGFRKQSPGPCGGLAVDEGIVHQCQGLSRNIGLITPAYRGVWDGQVEGNHQGCEKISAGLLIDGTASISIQRAIGIADPHAVSHEGSDVGEHRWPELDVVQIACSGQERVAQSLRFQTAEVLSVEQPVRRIPVRHSVRIKRLSEPPSLRNPRAR